MGVYERDKCSVKEHKTNKILNFFCKKKNFSKNFRIFFFDHRTEIT